MAARRVLLRSKTHKNRLDLGGTTPTLSHAFFRCYRKAESSGKDYEAIISRALLIKPMASMLKSYPDIYEVNVTCVEVPLCLSGTAVKAAFIAS